MPVTISGAVSSKKDHRKAASPPSEFNQLVKEITHDQLELSRMEKEQYKLRDLMLPLVDKIQEQTKRLKEIVNAGNLSPEELAMIGLDKNVEKVDSNKETEKPAGEQKQEPPPAATPEAESKPAEESAKPTDQQSAEEQTKAPETEKKKRK